MRPPGWYLGAYVNNKGHLDSKHRTSMWLESGVMDADGSVVVIVLCKLTSNALSVRGN